MANLMEKIHGALDRYERPSEPEVRLKNAEDSLNNNQLRKLLLDLSSDGRFTEFVKNSVCKSVNVYDPNPEASWGPYLTCDYVAGNVEFTYRWESDSMYGPQKQHPFEQINDKLYTTLPENKTEKTELPRLFPCLTPEKLVEGIKEAVKLEMKRRNK